MELGRVGFLVTVLATCVQYTRAQDYSESRKACKHLIDGDHGRQGCAELIIDLAFLVDGSGSICEETIETKDDSTCNVWCTMLNFMVNVVEQLSIGPDEARVALVIFAIEGSTQWNLSEFNNLGELTSAIRELTFPHGKRSNIAGGIAHARQNIFTGRAEDGDRPKACNVMIPITDGVSTRRTGDELEEAKRAQDDGTIMLAFGVTDYISEMTLHDISSFPNRENETWFKSADFNQTKNPLQYLCRI